MGIALLYSINSEKFVEMTAHSSIYASRYRPSPSQNKNIHLCERILPNDRKMDRPKTKLSILISD